MLSEVEFRDASSVTGKNIINIKEEFGVDLREMTTRQFRAQYRGASIPTGEGWKLELLRDILIERQSMKELGEDEIELDKLNSYINILAEI